MIEWTIEVGMPASAFLTVNCFILIYFMLWLVLQKAVVLIILGNFLQYTQKVINVKFVDDWVDKWFYGVFVVLKVNDLQVHQEGLFELCSFHLVYRLAAESSVFIIAKIRNWPCLKNFETIFAVWSRYNLLRCINFLYNMLRKLVDRTLEERPKERESLKHIDVWFTNNFVFVPIWQALYELFLFFYVKSFLQLCLILYEIFYFLDQSVRKIVLGSYIVEQLSVIVYFFIFRLDCGKNAS